MCLATLSNKIPKPTGFGWKVVIPFSYSSGFIGSVAHHGPRYQLGGWNTAVTSERYLDMRTGQTYTVGFHIFVRRKDAETYQAQFPGEVLVKVKYRKARLLGTGSDFSEDDTLVPQVIADEMMIVEVVKPGRKGKL